MNTRYYISTGALNNYYTLRFEEVVAYSYWSGSEQVVGHRTSDRHVCNLSTDRETAIAKAREITGQTLEVTESVDPITRGEERDWSRFHGGKYAGESVEAVFAKDPGYLVWICETKGLPEVYRRTVEIARPLVADILASREAERAAAKAEAEAKATSTRSRLVAAFGEETLTEWAKGDGFAGSVSRDILDGKEPSPRAISILTDIAAKAAGRRGSKKYDEARARIEAALA